MRKSIKPIVVAFILASCVGAAIHAHANYAFTGTYVGVGVMNNQTDMKTSWSSSYAASGDRVYFNGKQNGSQANLAGSITLGYGLQVANSYIIAPEIQYISPTHTNDAYGISKSDSFGDTYNYHSTIQLGAQVNFGVKLGKYLSQNDLVYIRPAIAYASLSATQQIFMVSNPASATQYPNITQNIWGTEIGAGYEHNFGNFALQGEMDYVNYKSYNFSASSGSNNSMTSVSPNQLRFGLSAIFKF